jgi:hypothetical protein
VIQNIAQTCSRNYEYCFNFATHSYFGTISKDLVLSIYNVSKVNIKHKNAICLLNCKKVNPLWNVFRGCGHSFHIECILTNISDWRPVCQAQLWQMLKLLEGLEKTAIY